MATKDKKKQKQKSSLDEKSSSTSKIKLKVVPGSKHAGNADSDEENSDDERQVAIEEHIIFRVPSGDMCNQLHEMVRNQELLEDGSISFSFRDPRRGQFHFKGQQFDTKLVDLPTIIETQKTMDKKHFFKVADISQMLIVDSTYSGSDMLLSSPFYPVNPLKPDAWSYPHGLTPPLHHVRKRRFRKRLSKRTIEFVEEAVERLLGKDAEAEAVKYTVQREEEVDAQATVVEDDVDMDGQDDSEAETPAVGVNGKMGVYDEDAEVVDSEEEGGDEVDAAFQEASQKFFDELDSSGTEDDESGSDEDEDEDEDGPNGATGGTGNSGTQELSAQQQILREDVEELEQTLRKKTSQLQSAPNPILKERFADIVRKLATELELKKQQLADFESKMGEEEEEEEDGEEGEDEE